MINADLTEDMQKEYDDTCDKYYFWLKGHFFELLAEEEDGNGILPVYKYCALLEAMEYFLNDAKKLLEDRKKLMTNIVSWEIN